MAYDLRDFVADLKKAGELVEIDREVDWNYEISALEVMSGRVGGPAFLFNKIKGTPEGGARMLVGFFAGTFRRPHRRIAIALGMDPDVDKVTFMMQVFSRMANMLRPVEVATGPCKEVIKMGKDVNLMEFPFLYHAIGDGGRYQFANITTIRDPDSDWINSGNYAIGVYSRNRLVITPYAHSNFRAIYANKYEARGQSMPVAVSLGGDPAVTIAAGTMLPAGVSEMDLAGGLRGTPMELVRAETSDLLVPANAEMVIEGEIRPYDRLPEGPKIEAFGFSVGPRHPFLAMRVNCITYRKNPIIYDFHTALGSGTMSMQEAFRPAGTYQVQKSLGMPIKLATLNSAVHGGGVTAFAMKDKPYPGFMHDIYDVALGSPVMSVFPLMVFVDGGVNILNYQDTQEAWHTQTNPARDWLITEPVHATTTLTCSWMEPEDTAKYFAPGTLIGPRGLFDATTKETPPLGVSRTSFETLYPDELQKWVVDNWQRLGFTEEPVSEKGWLEAEL
jgi:4-hydroxy-3-polyprenylbenzoate decarboxylase